MPDFDLISDLHLDMRDNAELLLCNIEPSSDTLLIAGDLCEARNLRPSWLNILAQKYPAVVYVPGNHEFYGTSFQKTLGILHDSSPPNVTVLYNDEIGFSRDGWESDEGWRVAGTTLWFPDTAGSKLYQHLMSDFQVIPDFKNWATEEWNEARNFLQFSWSDVWMVHHLPFEQSVNPKYEHNPLNRFFVGAIEKEFSIADHPPKVIVHGHTHEPCDYMAGDTRVVCNPLGYPQEGAMSIIPVKVAW